MTIETQKISRIFVLVFSRGIFFLLHKMFFRSFKKKNKLSMFHNFLGGGGPDKGCENSQLFFLFRMNPSLSQFICNSESLVPKAKLSKERWDQMKWRILPHKIQPLSKRTSFSLHEALSLHEGWSFVSHECLPLHKWWPLENKFRYIFKMFQVHW